MTFTSNGVPVTAANTGGQDSPSPTRCCVGCDSGDPADGAGPAACPVPGSPARLPRTPPAAPLRGGSSSPARSPSPPAASVSPAPLSFPEDRPPTTSRAGRLRGRHFGSGDARGPLCSGTLLLLLEGRGPVELPSSPHVTQHFPTSLLTAGPHVGGSDRETRLRVVSPGPQ